MKKEDIDLEIINLLVEDSILDMELSELDGQVRSIRDSFEDTSRPMMQELTVIHAKLEALGKAKDRDVEKIAPLLKRSRVLRTELETLSKSRLAVLQDLRETYQRLESKQRSLEERRVMLERKVSGESLH